MTKIDFVYRVVADEPSPSGPNVRLRDDMLAIACLVSVIAAAMIFGACEALLGLFGIVGRAAQRYAPAAAVVALAAGAVVFVTLRRFLLRKAARDSEREAGIAANKAADVTTRKLYEVLHKSYDAATVLVGDLARIHDFLAGARQEFKDSAYGPFWDGVERAAELMVATSERLRVLTEYATEYQQYLANRRHDFPAFPVTVAAIPDPRAIAGALHLIVRRGLTTFEFASIWEHRRTRKVFHREHTTIGGVLENCSRSMQTAYEQLRRVVGDELNPKDEHLIETVRRAQAVRDSHQLLLATIARQSSV